MSFRKQLRLTTRVAMRLLHIGMFLSILQLDAESSVEADDQGR